VANILNIPHHRQKADGYCLPACAQMALAYLGVSRSQEELARKLGLRPRLGVPASNITRLRSASLDILYTDGTLEDVANWLTQGAPVIAFVQAGELPHWRGHLFQHAVIIAGLDEQTVCLFDPAAETAPISTPVGNFLLAWEEMDCLCTAFILR
jgi:hypothetical protein